MSGDDLVERPLQFRNVQTTTNVERGREVIGGRAGFHLVREPEATLQLTEMRLLVGRSRREVRRALARRGLLQTDGLLQQFGACVVIMGRH